MLPASEKQFPSAPFSRKAKHSRGPGPAAWHCTWLNTCKAGSGAPSCPGPQQERGWEPLHMVSAPCTCLGRIWGLLGMLMGIPSTFAWCCCPVWRHHGFMQKKGGNKRRKIIAGVVHWPRMCVSEPAPPLHRDEPCGGCHQPYQGPNAREERGGSRVPPVATAQRQHIPSPQKGEAAHSQGYSWFPVTWVQTQLPVIENGHPMPWTIVGQVMWSFVLN